MLEHQAIRESVAFVERHGYALLLLWVLVEQSGVPLPSVPLLLISGALIRTGCLHFAFAIACCILAAVTADTIWFQLGRQRGRRVLRFLCRVSIEPDSCVRQTESAFLKYGMSSLLVSKFIPGLNAVAAPLAGNSRGPYWRFLLFDALGTSIWSAAYFAFGYIFSEQLETAMSYAARMGSSLVVLVVALFALWIAWKLLQRRRFLRQLDVARITPEELRDRLNAGEDLAIIDLRRDYSENSDIPGAIRIPAEELTLRSQEIPQDQEIILVCN